MKKLVFGQMYKRLTNVLSDLCVKLGNKGRDILKTFSLCSGPKYAEHFLLFYSGTPMPHHVVATTVVAVTLCYVVDLFEQVSDVVKH